MFVSLCSNPRHTFKSMPILAHVLINVISLLLLSFQAYTKSTLIVMWICTEAKIWVCEKIFWYCLLERTIVCSTECIFSLFCLYGRCCKSFVTYKPAYTWYFSLFFFHCRSTHLISLNNLIVPNFSFWGWPTPPESIYWHLKDVVS